ncbi:hypothetical protein [Amycolatopsis kentuckyensis]|uniref:hypothetical protein n=1 Tax=Amycolatopsis kentuckyensis TaxID=218823 RepID=UPI000A3BBCE0|nr:hypothetical protein [Amycolatopsis kentuckyensis]
MPIPARQPLVLDDVVARAELLTLFRTLAADPVAEGRFLDDPAGVLAAAVGWRPASHRVSEENTALVAALRVPATRARLVGACGRVPGGAPATIASSSASSSSSATFSSSTVTSASASVSTSTGFTTGGSTDPGPAGADPAVLRLRLRELREPA